MSRVLVPLAEGCEELETVTVVDVLRRAGIEVILAGIAGAGPCRGSRGVTLVPDMGFEEARGPWDLVVLPGGGPGTERLARYTPLLELLRQRGGAGQPLAAICAAPKVLDAAGVLPPHRYTCYPGVETSLRTPGRLDELVVDDGPVITSQGPGTALAFALHLVERLAGPETRRQVARGLLVD